MTVLGLDGCILGWLAIAVKGTGYLDTVEASTVAEAERIGLDR